MLGEFLHTEHVAQSPEQEFNGFPPQERNDIDHGPCTNDMVTVTERTAWHLLPPSLPPMRGPRAPGLRQGTRASVGVRVICRCTTNDHKLSSLKPHLGCHCSGPRRESSALGLKRMQSRCWPGWGFIWGLGSSSKVIWLLADFHSLQKLRGVFAFCFSGRLLRAALRFWTQPIGAGHVAL